MDFLHLHLMRKLEKGSFSHLVRLCCVSIVFFRICFLFRVFRLIVHCCHRLSVVRILFCFFVIAFYRSSDWTFRISWKFLWRQEINRTKLRHVHFKCIFNRLILLHAVFCKSCLNVKYLHTFRLVFQYWAGRSDSVNIDDVQHSIYYI